jgi:hypothetical protein
MKKYKVMISVDCKMVTVVVPEAHDHQEAQRVAQSQYPTGVVIMVSC